MERRMPRPPGFARMRGLIRRAELHTLGGSPDEASGFHIFTPNNERHELFRVRGARAALPQNCSLMKINGVAHSENGTSVPLHPTAASSAYHIHNKLLTFQLS